MTTRSKLRSVLFAAAFGVIGCAANSDPSSLSNNSSDDVGADHDAGCDNGGDGDIDAGPRTPTNPNGEIPTPMNPCDGFHDEGTPCNPTPNGPELMTPAPLGQPHIG